MLKNMEKDFYLKIYVFLLLAATIPATSYECVNVKDLLACWDWSKLQEVQLHRRGCIQHNHQIPLKGDEVIEEFAICHPRKLLL